MNERMKIHVLLLPALTLLGAGCSPESKVDDKNLNIEFQDGVNLFY